MNGEGLITGMKLTWKQFWKKKTTLQYPEEKLPMTECFRGGRLVVDKDKCLGCKLCSLACPNKALNLTVAVDENKKRHLEKYIHNAGRCLFCNLCIEACPTHVLKWDKNYEWAVYHKEELEYDCIKPAAAEQEVKKDD